MKNILLTALCLSVSVTVAAQDGGLAEKLHSGMECTVKFQTFYNNGAEADCSGTIARGVPYTIKFDMSTGKWTGTGYICNERRNQTHADGGPSPKDGYIGLWGKRWKFDDTGTIKDTDGNTIGKVSC